MIRQFLHSVLGRHRLRHRLPPSQPRHQHRLDLHFLLCYIYQIASERIMIFLPSVDNLIIELMPLSLYIVPASINCICPEDLLLCI